MEENNKTFYQVLLKQTFKELYEAGFEILETDKIIGKISIKSKLGSSKIFVTGTVYGREFSLKAGYKFSFGPSHKFKPYNIIENNNIIGEIFETEVSTTCLYKNKTYDSYGIALEEKGVTTLYYNNTQIAQIEKDKIIYNDLHDYKIYAVDEESTYISILSSCYGYLNSCYKSGKKITKSIQKNYGVTTDKNLLDKYNPNWLKEKIN